MADKKITALTAETDIDSDDLAHIVTDVSTSATNKKITVANVFNKIPTFIGYGADSVETVAADGALSATKAISILAASGTTTVQTTLADVTQIGFTKHTLTTNNLIMIFFQRVCPGTYIQIVIKNGLIKRYH